MTPGDELRRASARIRQANDEADRTRDVINVHPITLSAVADWLDATARELDDIGVTELSAEHLDGRRTAGLKVARLIGGPR